MFVQYAVFIRKFHAPVKSKEIILYCFVGQTACVDYLVGRSLGYTMKVYDGSMQEWSRDEKLPKKNKKAISR